MPQQRPSYVQKDIDKAKKEILERKKRGIPLNPEMFRGSFGGMYTPYSRTALKEVNDEVYNNVIGQQPIRSFASSNFSTGVTANRPSIAPINMPIRTSLEPSMSDLRVNTIKSAESQNTKNIKTAREPAPVINNLSTSMIPPFTSLMESRAETIPSYISPTLEEVPEIPLQPYPIQTEIEEMEQEAPEQLSTLDRLKELYYNIPTRDQYKPSKWRKFGAALAGGLSGAAFGPEVGMKVSSGIADKQFATAFQDWLNQSKALQSQAELEINAQKAEYAGLSDLANFYRDILESDPDYQAEVAGAKAGAVAKVEEPYKAAEETRRRESAERLEKQRQEGRKALEEIRNEREGKAIASREKISAAERASRENIAKRQITSRENIASKQRELREKLDKSRNQRVPVNQQFLAKSIAEHEISKIVSDSTELSKLFTQGDDGRYTLKPIKDISENWKEQYNVRKTEIDDLYKKIISESYDPNAEAEEDEIEDDYEIEEVD